VPPMGGEVINDHVVAGQAADRDDPLAVGARKPTSRPLKATGRQRFPGQW
jgi:hypothetical protein